MALAGLVLGYIGIALTVLAVGGLILFFTAFSDDVSQASLRSKAHEFAREVDSQAGVNGVSPRDPRLLEQVWLSAISDCCRNVHMYLPDGTQIAQATVADYERNAWQIEMEDDSFRTVYVCVTVPRVGNVDVRNGRCSGSVGGQAAP
jgi:hypothetical protein